MLSRSVMSSDVCTVTIILEAPKQTDTEVEEGEGGQSRKTEVGHCNCLGKG